jgi:hypothetical protein
MTRTVPAPRRVVEIKAGMLLKQRELDEQMRALSPRLKAESPERVRIVFDWSASEFADLATVLWCLVLFDQLKSQGYALTLKLPDPDGDSGHRFWSFLSRWRFFDALKYVDHPANLLPDNQVAWLELPDSRYGVSVTADQDGNMQQAQTLRLLEITSFSLKGDSLAPDQNLQGVFDRYIELWKKVIIIRALSNWCRWEVNDAQKFVSKTVVEFLENARDHSKGSWVLSGFSVDNKNLHLTVGDNGSGIPDTLRAVLGHNKDLNARLKGKSDAELIKYFAAPDMILDSELIRVSTKGIVSSQEGRTGRGLYYCKQMILENEGELRIRSGSACVTFTPDGKESGVDRLFKSTGTTIRVMIPRKA